TRLNDGCTPLKALNRIDFGFLNDDNSSITNISNGNIEPPYKPHSQDMLSRLIRYTSAFFLRASLRCFAVPIILLTFKSLRCSHFSHSASHTLSTTRLGPITKVLAISSSSNISFLIAVNDETVFPKPISRNKAA